MALVHSSIMPSVLDCLFGLIRRGGKGPPIAEVADSARRGDMMKKSKYTETQIVVALRGIKGGGPKTSLRPPHRQKQRSFPFSCPHMVA